MQIWLNIGFNMVVYLAGLQSIPQELYEAAEVDGASAWQRLRKITFPLLLPTTVFLLIFQTILGMQMLPCNPKSDGVQSMDELFDVSITPSPRQSGGGGSGGGAGGTTTPTSH